MSELDPSAPAAARMPRLLELLYAAHPDAHCELNHTSALELLVATILSAQCTDERVNLVTPVLFARYPTAQALAAADSAELESIIHSTGFYRNKAKNLLKMAQRLVEVYGGEVPATMPDLLSLAGVARKTANVVLGNVFGIAEGVVVDTHVGRLAGRLGLSSETAPEKIERDLMALTPQSEWVMLSHLLIFHGRRVCAARKPNCGACTLAPLCPSRQV